MVAPSGTLTALPSISIVTSGTVEHLELGERRLDRARCCLPEAADRRVAHDLSDLCEEIAFLRRGTKRTPAPQAVQQLLLPHGAHPARHALAARFVAEERGDAHEDPAEIRRFVQDHDDAGTERGADGPCALEGQRHADLCGREERAGGAAEENGLQTLAATHAAGEREQLGQHRAQGDLVQARRAMWPHRQKSFVPVEPGVPTEAKASPPLATISITFASVSTLFTMVGLPKRPLRTGNGGLLRGSPRRPSIELNSAVSSPQIYAPAPRRISISKRNGEPQMPSPSIPAARASSIAFCSRELARGYSPRTYR